VTYIGEYAFYQCAGLKSIDVDNSNTAYSSENGVLFDKAKTTLIRYPEGKAGTYAIPNSVISIGFGSFYDCSGLTSITIPSSVTSIENSSFAGCSGLKFVIIPNLVTNIGSNSFYGCSGLIEIINESTTPQTIEVNVFYGVGYIYLYTSCSSGFVRCLPCRPCVARF